MNQATDPARFFRKLARNNMLANYRLHVACSALNPGEFEAARSGFFPSIRATLNYILTIDWFYVDALEGGSLGPRAWAIEEPFAALDVLTEAQRQVDRRLVDFCNALEPAHLAGTVTINRDTRLQRERCEDVLSHLFQHQTHHRGQVHAMLSSTSVAPPQLDEFLVADDATARADEMAALGWSEDELMR